MTFLYNDLTFMPSRCPYSRRIDFCITQIQAPHHADPGPTHSKTQNRDDSRDELARRKSGLCFGLTVSCLFSSSLLLSSLKLNDTKVCEPEIAALLGNASHFCEVVVLEFRVSGPAHLLGTSLGSGLQKSTSLRGN